MNYFISLLMICISITSAFSHASYESKSLFVGTMQFPQTLENVPPIRIYYAGRKIPTHINQDGKRITFTIPEAKRRSFFYLYIAPQFDFCCTSNNIEYLKQTPSIAYKLYALELITTPTSGAAHTRDHHKNNQITQQWSVKEITLFDPTGKIPDDAIIICFDPAYIQSLEGGNAIEFPKIMIRDDITKLAGSEEKLHELSTRWLLAALNTDAIHDTIAPCVKQQQAHSKTIIAFN